jgi:hypothetical protein
MTTKTDRVLKTEKSAHILLGKALSRSSICCEKHNSVLSIKNEHEANFKIEAPSRGKGVFPFIGLSRWDTQESLPNRLFLDNYPG